MKPAITVTPPKQTCFSLTHYLCLLCLLFAPQHWLAAADHKHATTSAEQHAHQNATHQQPSPDNTSTPNAHAPHQQPSTDNASTPNAHASHQQPSPDNASTPNAHAAHQEPDHTLQLSTAELREFSIELAQAKPGVINKTLELTGEVIVAPERLYHVAPRVSGVVRQVFKHLGDKVQDGDILATLSSRDLATAKAQFVAADSLLQLANANLQRDRKLYQNKVKAKREYLATKQVQTEASIKRKASKQRLLAIGLSEKRIATVLDDKDKDLGLYELRATANGVIVDKHAVLGEVLAVDTHSFTVADLSKVWVNLTVYQKDLPLVKAGQTVLIHARFGLANTALTSSSSIRWLSPTLDEKTRSATARVVLDNPDGQWRPGLFVSAKVSTARNQAVIVIPRSAVQTIAEQNIVFVQHADGEFEPQMVKLGRKDQQQVEILHGLRAGQTYVSRNAFVLKAYSQQATFDDGHGH